MKKREKQYRREKKERRKKEDEKKEKERERKTPLCHLDPLILALRHAYEPWLNPSSGPGSAQLTQATPARIQSRGHFSSFLGLCWSTPIGTCSHARKEMYSASPILRHFRTSHASKEHGSHTRGMSTTHLSWCGQSAFLC
jgi:hypothetical protein